jgi:hypothetical protein
MLFSNNTGNSEEHWSDDFSFSVRTSIWTLEVCEWHFLLFAIIGMYQGIEIGHPGNQLS